MIGSMVSDIYTAFVEAIDYLYFDDKIGKARIVSADKAAEKAEQIAIDFCNLVCLKIEQIKTNKDYDILKKQIYNYTFNDKNYRYTAYHAFCEGNKASSWGNSRAELQWGKAISDIQAYGNIMNYDEETYKQMD